MRVGVGFSFGVEVRVIRGLGLPAWMASASGPRFVRTSAASLAGARVRVMVRVRVSVGFRVAVTVRAKGEG